MENVEFINHLTVNKDNRLNNGLRSITSCSVIHLYCSHILQTVLENFHQNYTFMQI